MRTDRNIIPLASLLEVFSQMMLASAAVVNNYLGINVKVAVPWLVIPQKYRVRVDYAFIPVNTESSSHAAIAIRI